MEGGGRREEEGRVGRGGWRGGGGVGGEGRGREGERSRMERGREGVGWRGGRDGWMEEEDGDSLGGSGLPFIKY